MVEIEVEVFAEPPMGGVLVFTGRTAVARHVRVQDGGELAGKSGRTHEIASTIEG